MSRKAKELPIAATLEEEALAAAIGNGEHWSVVAERLRAAGWQLTAIPGANDSEGARLFKGFPFPYEDDQRKIETLRRLANLLERGDAELAVMSVVFKYYVESNNEEGYELRTGLVRNLRSTTERTPSDG